MQTPDIPPQIPSSEPVTDAPKVSAPKSDSTGSAAVSPAEQSKPSNSKGGGFLSKVKTILSALLLIAVSGGIGYGVGILQNRGQVKQVREEQAAALTEVETQLTAAEAQVAAAEARSEYTRVQLRLLESIDELEQRNFGNANTQLRLASETLGKIEISKDPEALAALKEELSTAEINFAVNPVEQRRLMLGYAEQIEGLLPE